MHARLALIHSVLSASIVLASPTPRASLNSTQGIKWGSCDDPILKNGSMPLECGTVAVPLDYTNVTSNKTLDIELVKASHTKEPFKGSIIVNYGGPGGSGAHEHAGLAAGISVITGGHHDIIGFDQRGTGKTLLFTCFPDQTSTLYAALYSSWLTEGGNSSDVALGQTWATAGLFGQLCDEEAKEVGSLIGTAFTARDIMQFVDALEEDGMLRYWGFSYGTALGQTVASMFPDRMDKVILDGNLNPYQYWNYHDTEMYSDTDKVFDGFASGCVNHPSNCALAHYGSAADIQAAVYDLFDQLKSDPMYYAGSLIDWSFIRAAVFGALYEPSSYPLWAGILDGLIKGNASVMEDIPSSSDSTGDRRFGIVCGDKSTRGQTEAWEASREVMRLSQVSGDTAVPFIQGCGQWQIAAKERYEGDFRPKTRDPVLIIGNTFDPATPLRSAYSMSTVFEGSVVLEQHGYGHASLAQASNCTMGVIQDYFLRGELPPAGKVCQVDSELFAPA